MQPPESDAPSDLALLTTLYEYLFCSLACLITERWFVESVLNRIEMGSRGKRIARVAGRHAVRGNGRENKDISVEGYLYNISSRTTWTSIQLATKRPFVVYADLQRLPSR